MLCASCESVTLYQLAAPDAAQAMRRRNAIGLGAVE
jgi:hypothetical protein